MPRIKRTSAETIARRKSAKLKQETPEQRAARLESMRNYARLSRQKETESQREERLATSRCRARQNRQQELYKKRQQNIASILERCKDIQNPEFNETVELEIEVEVMITEME